MHGKTIRIATIDTMLSFYLAFLYARRGYFDPDRILCMAQFLFDVEQKNRLEQKGVLRRFSITCYGHQPSMEEIKAEKAQKFKELKDKKGTRDYEEYFLSYKPGDAKNKIQVQAQLIEEVKQESPPAPKQITKSKTKLNKKKRRTKRTKPLTLFDPYNSKNKINNKTKKSFFNI
jgi:hypothetical protein